jgi:8-oxo-(d)GTP phosphatase
MGMPILFLRHAKAGSRQKWEGPDHLRPLSDKGWRQAEGISELYRAFRVTRILSSPYLRCTQSVEPLARRLGIDVEEVAALAEGTGYRPTLALMEQLAGTTTVLCTHGDVMLDALDALEDTGEIALPDEYPIAKGCTWVLDGESFPFTAATYLAPPPDA